MIFGPIKQILKCKFSNQTPIFLHIVFETTNPIIKAVQSIQKIIKVSLKNCATEQLKRTQVCGN